MTGAGSQPRYARPVPTIGDTSSAAQRRDDPTGWAMGEAVTEALAAVVAGRRDIRRYRPDAVPEELITAVQGVDMEAVKAEIAQRQAGSGTAEA